MRWRKVEAQNSQFAHALVARHSRVTKGGYAPGAISHKLRKRVQGFIGTANKRKEVAEMKDRVEFNASLCVCHPSAMLPRHAAAVPRRTVAHAWVPDTGCIHCLQAEHGAPSDC